MIYEDIKQALKQAMMDKDKVKLRNVRLLKAEIDRDPRKNYSDDNVHAILGSLIKVTNKSPEPDIELLETIYEFMPVVSEQEVLDYVGTIDFSKLKNKMMAMGMVKKHFYGKIVDSEMLKSIIQQV